MGLSLAALDYGRPLLSLCKQTATYGRVHSVFSRVINIAFADTIVSIASDELQRTPNSIGIAHGYMDTLNRLIKKDMIALLEEGRLCIPACDCIISLPEKQFWEPRPDLESYIWHPELIAQHNNFLIVFLASQSPKEGLGSLAPILLCRRDQVGYCRLFSWGTPGHPQGDAPTMNDNDLGGPLTPLQKMALPLLRLVMLASWRQEREGIERAAKGLAGLGPGLTPSGDDVLAGFAAVMFLLSEQLSADGASRRYIAELIASIACPRTTLLSGSFLTSAARGELSESLGQLLLALVEADGALLRAARRVLDFGASSGSDTLLGVLMGLRTLEGERNYDFTSDT